MEILKIIHGFKSFNCIELFTKRRYIGFSSHEHTFEVNRCRLNIKKFFFSHIVVDLLNSLPECVLFLTGCGSYKAASE